MSRGRRASHRRSRSRFSLLPIIHPFCQVSCRTGRSQVVVQVQQLTSERKTVRAFLLYVKQETPQVQCSGNLRTLKRHSVGHAHAVSVAILLPPLHFSIDVRGDTQALGAVAGEVWHDGRSAPRLRLRPQRGGGETTGSEVVSQRRAQSLLPGELGFRIEGVRMYVAEGRAVLSSHDVDHFSGCQHPTALPKSLAISFETTWILTQQADILSRASRPPPPPDEMMRRGMSRAGAGRRGASPR